MSFYVKCVGHSLVRAANHLDKGENADAADWYRTAADHAAKAGDDVAAADLRNIAAILAAN